MKTSESITKIAPALLTAQAKISFAGKNAQNPHFKNKYADLPAVIDAVKDALNDAGIVFLQSPSPSDDGKLHLTTRLIHSSGEWIEDTAVCPLPKQDPQGFGSAITYLRRYSLASLIGLYQADDDGEASRMTAHDYIKKIANSKNMQELQRNYAAVYSEVKNDKALLEACNSAKDELKTVFEQGEQNANSSSQAV